MESTTATAVGSKQKICVIGDGGGAHVRSRVQALLRCGAEIELLTPRPSGISDISESVVENDGGDNIFENWSRAIASATAPVVNIHYGSSHGAWSFVLSDDQRPMALNLMGGDVLADEQSDPHFMARKLTRMVMRRADVVLVKSDFLGEAAQRTGVQPSSLQKLFWGVDRHVFMPGLSARQQLQLSPARFVIFSPRPLSAFYRADEIVRALPRMIELGIDPELVISEYEADPVFLNALRKLVADNNLDDRVHFRGPMDTKQMAEMYRSVDACIGIPPSDAFPQTVLEAMACDCVNVMTNLPRYQEFVRDGESVLFTQPTPEAISNAISELAQNDELRERLVAGGRAVLDKLPTLDESAVQLISELEKMPASTKGKIPSWGERASGRVALAALSRRFDTQGQ